MSGGQLPLSPTTDAGKAGGLSSACCLHTKNSHGLSLQLFSKQFTMEMPLSSPRGLQQQSSALLLPLQGSFPDREHMAVRSGEILRQVRLPTLTSKWGWETWPGCLACPLPCLACHYFALPSLTLPFCFP